MNRRSIVLGTLRDARRRGVNLGDAAQSAELEPRMHWGGWVSGLYLAQSGGGLRYGARVFELRQMGFEIECLQESVEGTKHSFYRLNREPGEEEILFPDMRAEERVAVGRR